MTNRRAFITGLVLLWFVLGVSGAGFQNAYFQAKYPACHGREDLGHSLAMAIGGPLNLFVSFLFSGFGEYGWSLNPQDNPDCRLIHR